MAAPDSTLRLFLVGLLLLTISPTGRGNETTGFQILSGSLPSILDTNGSPYLVESDIEVSPGDVVHIEPGVTLLFKDFTSLNVHGVLKALGTSRNPVFFTSVHDIRFNPSSNVEPAAYDWNGITITQSGTGTHLSHCRILYSLYGINALTDRILLDSCVFRNNGKSDFVVDGRSLTVGNGVYSFGTIEDLTQHADTVRVEINVPQQHLPWKPILRYSSLAVFIGGAAATGWQGYDFLEADRAFDNINDTSNPDNIKQIDIDNAWDKAKKKRDKTLFMTLATGVVSLLGAVGFGISFAF